jgi:hypothetical protein
VSYFLGGLATVLGRQRDADSYFTRLELVPAEKLDEVLHAHRAQVAAATRDAVVNGVAEEVHRPTSKISGPERSTDGYKMGPVIRIEFERVEALDVNFSG